MPENKFLEIETKYERLVISQPLDGLRINVYDSFNYEENEITINNEQAQQIIDYIQKYLNDKK